MTGRRLDYHELYMIAGGKSILAVDWKEVVDQKAKFWPLHLSEGIGHTLVYSPLHVPRVLNHTRGMAGVWRRNVLGNPRTIRPHPPSSALITESNKSIGKGTGGTGTAEIFGQAW